MGEVAECEGLSMKSEPLLSRDRLRPACALQPSMGTDQLGNLAACIQLLTPYTFVLPSLALPAAL